MGSWKGCQDPGKKKALDLMISKIPEDVKYIYVQHILNEEEALEVVEN